MRTRAGVLLPLLLLPLALGLPCFFGATWAGGDLIRQFHPWKELGRQAFLAGHLPLWNSSIFCGMPLAGNFQSGLFYPLHFYFYFLPFAQALGLHLASHVFLGGLGLYALARGLKLSRAGALLAALAWTGNAFFLARVEFMSALSAMAWTPWILAAMVSGWRWQWAGLAIGMQALAGYPLELGFSFVAALLLNLTVAPRAHWPRFFLAWLAGLCIGAVVLLPGLELLSQSSRAAGMADAGQNYALAFSDFKGWLLPVAGTPWAKLFSLSVAVLLLAPLARGRMALAAGLLCALGLLLSFGFLNPALNRHPTLALGWLGLGLALLAGKGSERIRQAPLYWLAAASLLIQPAFFSSLNLKLISAQVYEPKPAALALAAKITPQRRFLLDPAVQEERDSGGSSLSQAWSQFPSWMQANTAAPLGLKDACGYDPLAPAGIVAKLNAVSFPNFAADSGLLDELGVEALVGWRQPGEIRISKRPGGPPPRALFLTAKPISAADLKAGIPLEMAEPRPEQLRISLPDYHEAGWVFVNDTEYPGWKATLDGKPVAIEKSLEAFRLVAVGSEAGELNFDYEPLSIYIGLCLSLLALLLLLSTFKFE